MKAAIILTTLSALLALGSTANVVCTFFSWTVYREGNGAYAAKDVDPTLCTHILYAYVGLNEDGTVHVLDDWDITGLDELSHLVGLKSQNPNLKVLLTVGGYTEGSATYSMVAASPTLRSALVASVIDFLDTHNLDGFDLEWEWPGQREGSNPASDPANFNTLISELKTALNAKGYILSALLPGSTYYADVSYVNGAAISDNLDMINVMTYDYHGDWETVTGHNAPLHPSHLDVSDAAINANVASGIQFWLNKGLDPKKTNLGIATYGRTFTLTDPTQTGLYAPISGSGTLGTWTQEDGMIGYNEICTFDGDWQETWDDEQQVPHKVQGDQWIGYDDARSVAAKVELVNSLGLAGVMINSLDTDDFLGTCGTKYPLLNAIKQNLR